MTAPMITNGFDPELLARLRERAAETGKPPGTNETKALLRVGRLRANEYRWHVWPELKPAEPEPAPLAIEAAPTEPKPEPAAGGPGAKPEPARVGYEPKHARRSFPPAALMVPLVLVNTVAVWGQAGWAYEHIAPGSWEVWARYGLAIGFALAVESIGVYLALEAHDALMNDQASGLLRLGSYVIGGLAGVLNYWHFAGPGLGMTAQAVTFAALSSISPWLWAIRSRSLNRERLTELGLIDKRGVRLSMARKVWHPVRSLRVLRWAAWEGITHPDEAVRGWEARQGRK